MCYLTSKGESDAANGKARVTRANSGGGAIAAKSIACFGCDKARNIAECESADKRAAWQRGRAATKPGERDFVRRP